MLSETGTSLFCGATCKHTLWNIVAATPLPRVALTMLPHVAGNNVVKCMWP